VHSRNTDVSTGAAPDELRRAVDWPADWPAPGSLDLVVHDLPHTSSTTEWWYLNAHLTTADGRLLSVFAAFFRVLLKRHPDGRLEHAHSLAWALSDVGSQRYLASSRVDAAAPAIGLEKVRSGHGSKDPRLNRAITEVLERNQVPLPDRFFESAVTVGSDALALDFGAHRLHKTHQGYRLELGGEGEAASVRLTFAPQKQAVRHGDDGVVRGVHGEDMFYYFVPRCAVTGEVQVDGVTQVVSGSGWYDHEFGLPPSQDTGAQPQPVPTFDSGLLAWTWVSAQLSDGTEVSVYDLVHSESSRAVGRRAVLIGRDGSRTVLREFTLSPVGHWRSTRTFERYPTAWLLDVPDAQLSLQVRASFPDQEFVTVLSKPAFWEGRCEVTGTREGAAVTGLGYVERSGFADGDTLDGFFAHVGEAVRESVKRVAPLELDEAHATSLVASPGRSALLDGVDLQQLSRTLIEPVRYITDRGGKAWRSYAALACCDVVLGDSRRFAHWLAMPELMHTGSLIVDDVADRSTVRRGGPCAHLKYGEAIAMNAGTAAYFLGERLLERTLVPDAQKLRLYDLYFEALRAGHAGQALDLDGLAGFVPQVVESGDASMLERRVLAIHRFKTAAPASALARMGAVVGGGSEAQIEAVGAYFDALGLAFQIVDDVLNLKGFKGDLKQKGEDISQGKVTLPVARALGRLDRPARVALWADVASKPDDAGLVRSVIDRIEACGALDDCLAQAKTLIEEAWQQLDAVTEASLPKVMLRAFGWYVLERHY
jgi:geranylgeranyl pyrophosphate synthase/predicted secreted hydrolase